MNATSDPYPLPYPHDPLTPIADDVFMVRGSIKMNALMRITRNMAVIRHEGVLTLINPIRLNESGEAALKALGDIQHILRLGAFHGLDDAYYADRFKAKMWCQPGGKTYKLPTIDVELIAGCELPFPNADLIPFSGTKQPESVLLLKRGSGLMLTCDALQHYGDYRHNNWLARIVMPFIGFPKKMLIGPIWLKYMTPEGGTLKPVFDKLLDLDFDSMLSAHGSFLEHGAKDAVREAIDRAYP